MYNSKKYLSKNIPIIFKNNKFPKEHINSVDYWGNISKEKLHSCLPDGTAKLLTIDLDIGDQCSLACPHCFRRDIRFDKSEHQLNYNNIIKYIKEAKKLGLEEIKILGRGEPFQNKDFLKFLRETTKLDIGVSIFTKGFVIADDNLVKLYNSQYGINTGKELVKELFKLKVSILFGFTSFDKDLQEKHVGAKESTIKNYVKLRDKAIILFVKYGFNKFIPGQATRLAIISSPIKMENVNENLEMYKWANVRNIYFVGAPTMISGKGIDEFNIQKKENYVTKLTKLYTDIYVWAIKSNLITIDKFKAEGVSAYSGGHPCNQTASGFYLTLSGMVVQCPGRVDNKTIFIDDIRKSNMREVWINSIAYKRAKYDTKFNYRCLAKDGYSLPVDFYDNIYQNVLNNI